jgi:hypothetical protein
MIDSDLATLALRNRMLALSVCTTGSTTLAATATGYTRAAGSFLADGFRDGMEFLAAGFTTPANNGYHVIESVSALTIITTTAVSVAAPVVEGSASGRTLSVGVPEGRLLDNKRFAPNGGPFPGRPYIVEEFVQGTHELVGYPSEGSRNEERGLYLVKWYGLEGKGEGGIRRPTDALKRRFAPGTVVSLNDGTIVRMPRETAAISGQILPQGDGWAVCTVSIPWRADTTNTIAA